MNIRARPILLLTFVNAVGGTLLIPVLPFIVRDVGQSDVTFALLIAAYPACQFFAAPLLGAWADYRGRRGVLLLSQTGTLLSWVIFAAAYFVDGAAAVIGLIALSRVVDGITGGNASVAAAYLVDVTTEEERTRMYAVQGSIVGVALLVGPALGSISADTSIGFLGPAIVAIALSALTLGWLALSLEESLAEENRRTELDLNPLHQLNLLARARTVMNAQALQRLFGVQALFTFAFSAYVTVVILIYADRLGLDPSVVGFMLLATGTFLIINELVTVRIAERLLGDSGALILGLALVPVGLVLIRLPTSVPLFLAASFVFNAGLALVMPTLQSAITKAADETEEGEVQGLNTSVAALASTIAPVAGGVIYAAFGIDAVLVFAAIAALALLAFLASRQLIVPPTVEVSGAETLRRPSELSEHGPFRALAHHRGGSHRLWGLQLHGRSHLHHGLRHRTEDQAQET